MTYPTQDYLKQRFDYREDGNLIWKYDPTKSPQWNGKHGAQVAGHRREDGYRVIRLDKKLYLASRLIFCWHYGYYPIQVDHKDINETNDRIENLRASTHSKNQANTNAFGYIRRGNKFVSKIYHHGKSHHLGTYSNRTDARAAYEAAKEELLEDYYGE